MMKISKSEKILLSILIALIIGVVHYKFVFTKEYSKIVNLNSEKLEVTTEFSKMKEAIASVSNKETEIKVLNSSIQADVEKLYPAIEQKRIIVELDELSKKSNVQSSFTFETSESKNSSTSTDGTANITEQYSKLKETVSKYNTEVLGLKADEVALKQKGYLNTMTAKIAFTGSYENIIAMISNIQNHNKKIVISNIEIGSNSESVMSCVAQLEFYSIPKFDDMDTEYLKWNYANEYGKDNPFSSNNTGNSGIIAQAGQTAQTAKDFSMAVKSVNSDLPAIMLGKYNDKDRKTFVYADKNETENVELTFTEQNGKYYYKYKSTSSSYPAEYSGLGTEFTPSGTSINFSIYSSNRTSDTDNVGVNITVINNTSKSVDVVISNEDASKPRVSVTGEGSAVNVKSQ